MREWLNELLHVRGIDDEDQLRRARLLVAATATVAVGLTMRGGVAVISGELGIGAARLVVAGVALAVCLLARRGRLAAAEWATAALVALASAVLVLAQGPSSLRLAMLHLGVVLLGLAARPWMAPASAAWSILLVVTAVAFDLPIPLAGSTSPAWHDVVRQIVLASVLILTLARGYRRLHATLAKRTVELEHALDDLLGARARLAKLVEQRTAELEHASAELEAFASTVSHDLRAPLRHIHSYLELFAEDAAELGGERLAPLAAARAETNELMTKLETVLAESRRAARAELIEHTPVV